MEFDPDAQQTITSSSGQTGRINTKLWWLIFLNLATQTDL